MPVVDVPLGRAVVEDCSGSKLGLLWGRGSVTVAMVKDEGGERSVVI